MNIEHQIVLLQIACVLLGTGIVYLLIQVSNLKRTIADCFTSIMESMITIEKTIINNEANERSKKHD